MSALTNTRPTESMPPTWPRKLLLVNQSATTIPASTGCPTTPDTDLSVRIRVIEGAAVVRFDGDLNARAVPACRNALDTAQRIRAARIVLDLEGAKVDAGSIPLLAEIVRIAARHGTVVDLVGFPPVLRMALARTTPVQIRLFPAVDVALRTGPKDFRPGWRIGPESGVER